MAGKLTGAQLARLAWVDRKGTFTDEDKSVLPGLHFCPDWDYAAICTGSPEVDGCTCGRAALEREKRHE